MEKIYGDEVESHLAQVAHHYVEALPLGNVDKAVEFARRGAQRARDQLAFAEAVRLYGMALRAIMAGPQRDETVRCELLLEMGESQAQGRSLEEEDESFEQAADVARKLDRSDLLSRAVLSFSTWFGSFFSIDSALKAMLAEVLAALSPNDTPIRATLMAKLAGESYWSGEHERGRTLCDEAVAVARRTGDPRALVSAFWGQNEINWGPENVEARLAAATEIAALAESVGDYQRALRAREWFAALLEMGDVVALTSEVHTYRALAAKWGERFGIVERFNAALALLKEDFDKPRGKSRNCGAMRGEGRIRHCLLAPATLKNLWLLSGLRSIPPRSSRPGRRKSPRLPRWPSSPESGWRSFTLSPADGRKPERSWNPWPKMISRLFREIGTGSPTSVGWHWYASA